MESTLGPPDFGLPLPFKHDPVGGRVAYENLCYLDVARKFAEYPSAWSFRLYRAVFGPGTDERFAKAVDRLREWVQWSVRNSRYIRWVKGDHVKETDWTWPRGKPHETDEVARRFWIDVVEDYPGCHENRAGLDVEPGTEDFSLVGRAFLSWLSGRSKPVDEEDDDDDEEILYTPYCHCLIVDEKALVALETLPDTIPDVKPRTSDEWDQVSEVHQNAWVWLLDRKTMKRQEAGEPLIRASWMKGDPDLPHFPPWCRISIADLYELWFRLPQKTSLAYWNGAVMEGRKVAEYGKIRYWAGNAPAMNEVIVRYNNGQAKEHAKEGSS